MKLNITLQNAYGRKYAWSYYVRENEKVVLSGAVYYSSYPSYYEAEAQIKKELEYRLENENVDIEKLFQNAIIKK